MLGKTGHGSEETFAEWPEFAFAGARLWSRSFSLKSGFSVRLDCREPQWRKPAATLLCAHERGCFHTGESVERFVKRHQVIDWEGFTRA
jgi:hypothetical protein